MKLSVGGLAANLAYVAIRTLRPPAVGYRAAIFGHFRTVDSAARIVDNPSASGAGATLTILGEIKNENPVGNHVHPVLRPDFDFSRCVRSVRGCL